jgi:hypothetical protein
LTGYNTGFENESLVIIGLPTAKAVKGKTRFLRTRTTALESLWAGDSSGPAIVTQSRSTDGWVLRLSPEGRDLGCDPE